MSESCLILTILAHTRKANQILLLSLSLSLRALLSITLVFHRTKQAGLDVEGIPKTMVCELFRNIWRSL
jgi:hypothetical protein